MQNITLNDEQQNVLDNLTNFVEKSDNSMALLEGCAGSGKTTVCQFLIEAIHNRALMHKIAMVAPTWKAVKVMKEMCPEQFKSHIFFCSLHSLLGLKHQITKEGKEIFVRDKKDHSKLAFYDIIIVDEASMVADQLFDEIVSQNYRGIKILFVGDSNQINPVNHKHAIPMLEDKREEYKIEHYKLTKIVRQAEGNPIIHLSQNVLKDKFKYENGMKDVNGDTGIVMISSQQSDVLRTLLKYYFCSPEFDNNANHCKVIAWRNVTVDEFNRVIRTLKYGRDADKIVVNEKLIVDRPIKGDSDTILFTTNEDLVVLDAIVEEKTIFGKTFKYYDTEVQGDTTTARIHLLHEDSESLYKITLDEFAVAAKKESDPGQQRKKWLDYFSFIENFSHVKYNYAITVHNSQGSTYDNCFAYYNDINLNYNTAEKKRILYTAFTRPRKMLYIL